MAACQVCLSIYIKKNFDNQILILVQCNWSFMNQRNHSDANNHFGNYLNSSYQILAYEETCATGAGYTDGTAKVNIGTF